MPFNFFNELLELIAVILILCGFLRHEKRLESAGLKLKKINWRNILLIVFLVVVVNLLFIWWSKPLVLPASEYSVFKLLFLSPVGEEFLVRGLFLGVFPAILLKIKKLKFKEKDLSFKIILGGLFFIQAGVFFLLHTGGSPAVLINGFLFGAVFLASKKNLLASMAAHASANLLIVVIQAFGLLPVIVS